MRKKKSKPRKDRQKKTASVKELLEFIETNYDRLKALPKKKLKIKRVNQYSESGEYGDYYNSEHFIGFKLKIGKDVYIIGHTHHIEDEPNSAQAESYTSSTCHDEEFRQWTDKRRWELLVLLKSYLFIDVDGGFKPSEPLVGWKTGNMNLQTLEELMEYTYYHNNKTKEENSKIFWN
jgi:hypothetical protein